MFVPVEEVCLLIIQMIKYEQGGTQTRVGHIHHMTTLSLSCAYHEWFETILPVYFSQQCKQGFHKAFKESETLKSSKASKSSYF